MVEAQRVFRAERDAKLAGQGLWPDRSPAPLDVLARAVLDLFAKILAEKQKPTVALNHWKARALAAESAVKEKDREVAAAIESHDAWAKSWHAKLEAAEAALAGERERCAKVAEAEAGVVGMSCFMTKEDWAKQPGLRIAAAIRAGE